MTVEFAPIKARWNKQIIIIEKVGEKWHNDVYDEENGGHMVNKLAAFDEKGGKIGAVIGGFCGNYLIVVNNKTVGSVRPMGKEV